MLRTGLLQPDILRALAAAGHGSQVLLADGNFPTSTIPPAHTPRVYLNLARDRLTVTEVLDSLISVLPIEMATLMNPADGGPRPAAHDSLEAQLPAGIPVVYLPRLDFYAAARSDWLALVIATGDQRAFANVLLTIGVDPGS